MIKAIVGKASTIKKVIGVGAVGALTCLFISKGSRKEHQPMKYVCGELDQDNGLRQKLGTNNWHSLELAGLSTIACSFNQDFCLETQEVKNDTQVAASHKQKGTDSENKELFKNCATASNKTTTEKTPSEYVPQSLEELSPSIQSFIRPIPFSRSTPEKMWRSKVIDGRSVGILADDKKQTTSSEKSVTIDGLVPALAMSVIAFGAIMKAKTRKGFSSIAPYSQQLALAVSKIGKGSLEIKKKLGDVIGVRWAKGVINNIFGKAKFDVRVYGNKGEGTVRVEAHKPVIKRNKKEWQIKRLMFIHNGKIINI